MSDPVETRFRTVCTGCGAQLDRGFNPICAACGAMADVEYDLSKVEIYDSPNPFLRFRDLLPVSDPSLLPADARPTRTVHAERLGQRVGLPWLYLKDETGLPTGTTKDRMAGVALAYLYECGVRTFCTSSTGNSSTAYAQAILGIPELVMHVFTAERFADRIQAPDTPRIVNYVLRDATFVEAFDAARDHALRHGLVSERGFFNPGRREGLKLAWLEATDQVPRPIDWYAQAVSSAMGVYGVDRGAQQLLGLGLIDRLPRLLCVQQATCAPMVAAWEAGSDRIRAVDVVERPEGIALAILRGNPTAAYPPVRARVVATGGGFVAVDEREIREAHGWLEEDEGISVCFASAACLAGVVKSRRLGTLPASDTVLVNLTGRDRTERSEIVDPHWLERGEGGWVPASVP